ncbi:MAG: HAMP domain-containing histidine kinase [Ktedonobacterales bacterium]|nr:HAMP domain-containing histidine kinase [Ktedonobacterales bacterium]
MSEFVLDSAQSARQLNLERGIRLARITGRAFVPAITLSWLLALLMVHLPPSKMAVLTVGATGAVVLLVVGVWLAEQRHAEWAARFIITGTQLAATIFQFVWAWEHGIDGVVLALFLAQTIPIGLASALSGPELLRNTLIVTICIITAVFLSGELWFHSTLTGSVALATWVLVVFFTTVIAALLYGGGVYYAQALAELGTIRTAYERAQRLDELKDQFITHVNHELRTPIMTMQGIIEFLQAARKTMPAEQETQLFAQASRNADRLVEMLSSILDVRKITREGPLSQAEMIDLSAALKQAREVVDPLGQRAFRTNVAPHLAAWADPQLAQQVLVNLLNNALKYSPASSPVEIWAHPLPEGGMPEKIQVHIRDYGAGIPADQIPLLFHRFVRLPRDMASNIPGSGIGLYLSKAFTEAMGGRIWVESAGIPGEGSDFILELPTVEAATPITAVRARPRQRRNAR